MLQCWGTPASLHYLAAHTTAGGKHERKGQQAFTEGEH